MKVFEFVPDGIKDCYVRAWLHEYDNEKAEKRLRPAIVICPGGGYAMVSEREAEPVALAYFSAGYETFILNYAVKEQAKDFYPLCQLASTVAHVRKKAQIWSIDESKIAVCGFSAGGHLATSLGVLFNKEEFLNVFGRTENIRPDAMILGYPVITADEYAHVKSIEYVSGSKVGSNTYNWFGIDKHVDTQTPPAFVWHTAEDQTVPVENSLKLSAAFSAAQIPFELHVFPKGAHGMSVCTEEVGETGTISVYNSRWIRWSIEWLNQVFDFRL